MSSPPTITVLGLGAMGSRIAHNYIDAGHAVTVWNRTAAVADRFAAERDAAVAATPRAAAEDADVVVSMVTDDDAADEVWLDGSDGALTALRPGAVIVESSTVTPNWARRLAGEAGAAGVGFVEAPVVGSRPQADAGALFYLLGGDAATIEDVRPVIDVNAGGAVHVGEAGTAATMKLAINGLFAAQVATYAEIVELLARSGLDRTRAIELISGLPITSPGLARILGLIDERDFAPNFPIRLVAKDLEYLASTADAVAARRPIIDATLALFASAADGEHADLDIAGIAASYVT